MEKTETMKRFEKETGIVAMYSQYDEWLQKDVFYPKDEYVDWLEHKVEGYEKLKQTDKWGSK